MKNIFFLLSCLVSIFFSCQKVGLPDENKPIFSLAGSLNDTNFIWLAGVNDKYMLAKTDISTNGLPIFIGNLGNVYTSYENVVPSIEIIFVGQKLNSSAPISFAIDSNLTYGSNNSIAPTIYQLLYDGSNSIGSNIQKYEFNFANQFSNQISDKFGFQNPDVQGLANLKITGPNGITSTQSSFVDLFNNQFSFVEIVKKPNNMLSVQFYGQNPLNYAWNTGNSTPTITINPPISPISEYSVTATLPNLQQITNNVWLDSTNTILYQAKSNFDYNIISDSLSTVDFQPNTVIVRYFDAQRRVFSTEFTDQTVGDFFRINAVSDYIPTELGVKTKQLDVKFACKMSNADHSATYFLKNVSGKIAVGVPD